MSEKALPLEILRSLTFSAASALVRVDDLFCTVSDDQLQLEMFSLRKDAPSTYLRLFPGELPTEKRARKAAKPDFESLLLIPNVSSPGAQLLLALPSGSTPQRSRGALIRWPVAGSLNHSVTEVDFTDLYAHLELALPELNIEGAAFCNSQMKLFQRGNGRAGENAIIDLDGTVFLKELCENSAVSAKSFLKITKVSLPTVQGIPTSFTDAASDPETKNLFWFLAAAEQSASTYEDGPFTGALLGCGDSDNQILRTWPLEISEKPEGLWLDVKQKQFFVVTDTDNPEIPSKLLRGSLPEVKT